MISPVNVKKVIGVLGRKFPDPKPPLNFSSPFELLVAVVLAAQCTDERVNQTTPALFPSQGGCKPRRVSSGYHETRVGITRPKYNTPQKLLTLGVERLRDIIHSCGYHNQKAKNLIACANVLVEKHGGRVPGTLEELTSLPGIGRKSASVILSQSFGIPAFPVDTHVFRVANRIGIVNEKTVEKTADALEERIPKEKWIPFHLQLIFHGRKTCKAPKPRCWECPIKDLCEFPYKTSPLTKQKAKNT